MSSSLTVAQQSLYLATQLFIFLQQSQSLQINHFGNMGRFGIFNILPINSSQEWMCFYIICSLGSQSVHKVFVKKLAYEIFGLRSDHVIFIANLRPFYIKIGNIVNNFLNGVSTERPSSNQELIGHNSQTPPIDSKVIDRSPIYNLWCNVVRCTN